VTGQVLGYEASTWAAPNWCAANRCSRSAPAASWSDHRPGHDRHHRAKEEMRVGDRLLPEPPRSSAATCRAPPTRRSTAASFGLRRRGGLVGQNQVVVINRGTAEGMENGHVLAILKAGAA
jgi:hypothetical protein